MPIERIRVERPSFITTEIPIGKALQILNQLFLDPGLEVLSQKREEIANSYDTPKRTKEAFYKQEARMQAMIDVNNNMVESAHITNEALWLIKDLIESKDDVDKMQKVMENIVTLYNEQELQHYYKCIARKVTDSVKIDIHS